MVGVLVTLLQGWCEEEEEEEEEEDEEEEGGGESRPI